MHVNIQSIKPKTVDTIRDLAIKYESNDLELAYDLMLLAHILRPTGPVIKQKFDMYAIKLKLKTQQIQKAHNLMQLESWEEALYLWSEIRENYPEDTIGYMQAGIALKNLGRIDESAKLWLKINSRDSLIFLSEIMDRLDYDSDDYNKILELLINEKFDFINPTILSIKLQRQNDSDKNSFESGIKYLKNHLNKLDYFTKISLGLDSEIDIKYLEKIFMTNNIELIKRIASSDLFLHGKNMHLIKKYQIYQQASDIIKKAYINLFNDNKIEIRKGKKGKKLKIALCISGQLRGYRKSYNSWNKFVSQKNHTIDTYCCVWNSVGTKEIINNERHLERIFSKNFIKEFISYIRGFSNIEIKQKFPHLIEYLSKSEIINETILKSFYNAKKVDVVEEEAYKDKSNMYKMHYMIERCYKLIDNPQDYDIIVRIRPDKQILKFDIDWSDIYNILSDNLIISDIPVSIHTGVGLVMGDQFAIGTPKVMKEYSETFTKVDNNIGIYSFEQYKDFRPHMSLCLSILEKNIDVQILSKDIGLGTPLNERLIENKTLIELISIDLKNESESLKKLIDAIERDEKEMTN